MTLAILRGLPSTADELHAAHQRFVAVALTPPPRIRTLRASAEQIDARREYLQGMLDAFLTLVDDVVSDTACAAHIYTDVSEFGAVAQDALADNITGPMSKAAEWEREP